MSKDKFFMTEGQKLTPEQISANNKRIEERLAFKPTGDKTQDQLKMAGKMLQGLLNQDTMVEVPEEQWTYSMRPLNGRFSVQEFKQVGTQGLIKTGSLALSEHEGLAAYRFYTVYRVADNVTMIKPGEVVVVRCNTATQNVFEFPDRVEYHFFAHEVVAVLEPNNKPDNVTVS